jgi:surface antigen
MPKMRRAWPALIVTGFLVCAHAGAARAQIINPFGVNNGNQLTKDDFTLGRAAVAKLLDDSPAVGRYEDWSNPATGNHGKLTITDIYSQNSMPCRKLDSLIEFSKKGAAPNTLIIDVCKTSSGWKVVS